jgi:hypothetical protein
MKDDKQSEKRIIEDVNYMQSLERHLNRFKAITRR